MKKVTQTIAALVATVEQMNVSKAIDVDDADDEVEELSNRKHPALTRQTKQKK